MNDAIPGNRKSPNEVDLNKAAELLKTIQDSRSAACSADELLKAFERADRARHSRGGRTRSAGEDAAMIAFSMHPAPGMRLWLDRGSDRKTGEWRMRMPSGDDDPDEEGSVWIAQDVIDAIISAQNSDQDQPKP
jgi:hypothetical protein